MKLFKIVSLIITVSLMIVFFKPTESFAQAVCQSVNGEITTLGNSAEVTGFGGIGWCLITPEKMQIELDYIGLCKSQPAWNTYLTDCNEVFSSSPARLTTISKETPFDLGTEISIEEGEYPYAVIVVSNKIKHSSAIKFNSVRNGYGPVRGTPSSGQWCWSIDDPNSRSSSGIGDGQNDLYIAECGNSLPSQLGYNSSIATSVRDGNGARSDLSSGTTDSTTWDVYLVDSAKNRNWDAGNQVVTNASYFIGIQKFNNSVQITPNTSNVDLGFKLTNTFGLNVDMTTLDGNGDMSHVKGFVLGGFEFKVIPN